MALTKGIAGLALVASSRQHHILTTPQCAAAARRPPAAAAAVAASCSSSSSSADHRPLCSCSQQAVPDPPQQHTRKYVIACAAGRGTRSGRSSSTRTRRGSSDDGGSSSSAWQDRIYSGGSPDRDEDSNEQGSYVGDKQQQQQRQRRSSISKQGGVTANSLPESGGSTSAGSRSSRTRGRSKGSAADAGSSEFVVIKKGGAGAVGSYIPSMQELQSQEDTLDGSRFWEAALDDFGDEGEDEYDEFDEFEEGEEGDEGEGDEDPEVEDVISLLQELAAGLEDEAAAAAADSEDHPKADGSSDSSSSSSQGASSSGGSRPTAEQQQLSGVAVRWQQAYLGSAQPPLTLGHVVVKQSAGKGRGLFTTTAVKAGDVLLAAAPLALLYSEEGATPENEELAEHLVAAVAATAAAAGSSPGSSAGSRGLAPWQQHALLQLRGPGSDSSSAQQQQQQLPELQQLLGPPEEPIQAPDSSSSSKGQQQQQQQLPSAQEVTQLAFANCTGEEFEDQALVLLRGATSCGHLGVWPAAALINHACAPNCHAMLVGDRLVVRAAHDIPATTELTLSYLGPQLFAPAAVRQAELKQQWGFDCGCNRCKAEARYAGSTGGSSSGSSSGSTGGSSGSTGGSGSSSSSSSSSLASELQAVYSRCQQLSPQLDAAMDAEDLQAVRQVQSQLLELQSSLEAGIKAAKPPAHVRRWLQASVFDLYDLLSLAADQLPPPPPKASRAGRGGRGGRGGSSGRSSRDVPAVETEALAACARIVGELTPGSSAHVELATEYMVRTEARFGSGHQEADDASRMCAAAITTRYGPVSNSMLQLLMDTWAGAALL